MPIQTTELNPIETKILSILKNDIGNAYSSKEIAKSLDIAHSTARKHLKSLFDKGEVKRGKQKDFNKTFFYYVEN